MLFITFSVVHESPEYSQQVDSLNPFAIWANQRIPQFFIYDVYEARTGGIILDEETVEFNVAHNRKYSTDHLWYQEKDERLMIGVSEFLKLEIGDVLRVILPQAETEVDEGDGMFSIWTAEEKKPFPAPFSGLIAEVNGEVEINPDLANDSAYDLGWIIILEPHDLDLELLLDPDEYVEYLAEL